VSKKSSARFLVVLLSVTLTTAAVVFADLCAFAQDTGATQNANAGSATKSKTSKRHTPRRHRRHSTAAAASATTGTTTGATAAGEQTDLSGTYTGTINCMGSTGDGTLTVNGNQFTLSGASSASGRITAVTTRGYTGATLRFDAAGGGTPTSVSVRAKKSGDRLWLTPVPGEPNKCSFTPGGGAGARGTRGTRGTRRRGHHAAAPAATETTTPPSDTSATPAAGDTSTTPATTTPRRHRTPRRSRRGTGANANMGGGNANSTPPQF
jgi:hypothetical protein